MAILFTSQKRPIKIMSKYNIRFSGEITMESIKLSTLLINASLFIGLLAQIPIKYKEIPNGKDLVLERKDGSGIIKVEIKELKS